MHVFRGTIDDCELVDGLVLTQKVANTGITRVEKAKIGLIQFCLSPPKTDVSHLVFEIISWYLVMKLKKIVYLFCFVLHRWKLYFSFTYVCEVVF